MPNRREMLEKTIESLYSQVDVINLCLNDYEADPFADDPKINTILADNSLGDAGKFLFQEQVDGYYLTCDDDIVYPPTYVKDITQKVDEYGVVTFNGRIFKSFPIKSFYKDKAKKYRYGRNERKTLKVQFGGTGVMAFDTRFFSIPISEFKRKNMADIWVGCFARKNGYPIWHLAHKEGYLTSQKTEGSIYEAEQDKDAYQTAVINEVF
ncbi:hypothetical protein [Marinobacter sp. CHS3-4]|uniref:hypothetical protein n=1 Tax=Marinobacter sp. CHS3-4 TaxID=3045174 RepID=UPI0024B55179|nr:hypothetical protein [Marinobacter sp. CHS3-4]MDI9246701.1 hypothetical protein [Marinobacter sp. CHS3-4]